MRVIRWARGFLPQQFDDRKRRCFPVNKTKYGKIAAVIEIGSSFVKMKICQRKKDGILPVDQLEYPLRIGHEVFHLGAISFECLKELTHILRGFQTVLEEYQVEDYQVVATTALREAKNKSFVCDQLRVQNRMQVKILEDNQEKNLIYSEVLKAISKDTEKKGRTFTTTLVSHIGTGSIGLSLFDGTCLHFSQNISIGSLKLHDVLGSIQDDTEEFYDVVEEYLEALLGRVVLPVPEKSIDGMVVTGNEIELIAKLCDIPLENDAYCIPTETITALFQTVRSMNPDTISVRYQLNEEQAEMLYSALAIYVRLLKMTQSKSILAPKVELWDPLMRHMLIPDAEAEYWESTQRNAIACAKTFAQRYRCSEKHAAQISQYACKIFDRIQRIHGLDQRHRMILELSAILHESGYFVDSKFHRESTFDLIQNIDLCGVTYEEMLMTAYVARFNEMGTPNYDDLDFIHIPEEQKVICSKLAAIFRLANALDKSHRQKIKSFKVKLEEERLIITIQSDENVRLEQWAFALCSPFFKDVFGIQPCLALQSTLL